MAWNYFEAYSLRHRMAMAFIYQDPEAFLTVDEIQALAEIGREVRENEETRESDGSPD